MTFPDFDTWMAENYQRRARPTTAVCTMSGWRTRRGTRASRVTALLPRQGTGAQHPPALVDQQRRGDLGMAGALHRGGEPRDQQAGDAAGGTARHRRASLARAGRCPRAAPACA
jgi:hypothetical protein